MMSRMRSIKVLNHALSTPDGLSNCERFVEIFGLKSLFSAFMRKVNGYIHISSEFGLAHLLLMSLRSYIDRCRIISPVMMWTKISNFEQGYYYYITSVKYEWLCIRCPYGLQFSLNRFRRNIWNASNQTMISTKLWYMNINTLTFIFIITGFKKVQKKL